MRAPATAGLVTAGNGSISTSTISAASLAWARVSATTQAMASPPKRTLSVGRTARTGVFHGVPSRLGTVMPHFIGMTPPAVSSAPV